MVATNELTTALDDAVKAHAAWKMRLRKAATKKERDLPVDTIYRDDCCKFGKWLNALPPELQNTEDASKVRALHTAFHLQAGHVAKQISDEQYTEALDSLHGAGYTEASKELTRAVASWKLNELVKIGR